jgi:hypothetical protein
MDSAPGTNVDTVSMELIIYCAKYMKKKGAKKDGVCLPPNPTHPTYSIDTLRSLVICRLYLFKWVKWNPFINAHGSHVASVLGAVGRSPPGLPLVMEVGELCQDILAHHPHLAGDRVHNQIHPAFIVRSLDSVLLSILFILDALFIIGCTSRAK